MKLHFLVEGPSEKALLDGLLPRLLSRHTFQVHPHQGKGRLPANPNKPPDPRDRTLLGQLPAKLRAYGQALRSDAERVVILLDLDDEDLDAQQRKLTVLLSRIDVPPTCMWCFAIEEVEAWYLGDWAAVRAAYPRASKAKHKAYEPDSICGTWELFQQVIGDAIERKPQWAAAIAPHLCVDDNGARNRSPSFRTFCKDVRSFAGEPERRRPGRSTAQVRRRAPQPERR